LGSGLHIAHKTVKSEDLIPSTQSHCLRQGHFAWCIFLFDKVVEKDYNCSQMSKYTSLLPFLFRSKTRIAILSLLFRDPEKEYYLRQMEELTGYSVGNVRREMLALEAAGLVHARYFANVRLYKLNTSYQLYQELKSILRKSGI